MEDRWGQGEGERQLPVCFSFLFVFFPVKGNVSPQFCKHVKRANLAERGREQKK